MKKTILFLAILGMACQAVASGDYGNVDIHGFISQGWLISDDHDFYYADTDEGTFEFNEMGINFGTQLSDSLRMGMQLLAKDLGELGNDEINLDWAFADYQFTNWLGFRAGKMKKTHGMYNQSRDIDATRTCILLPTGFYNESQRESQMATRGVGIYGTLPGHLDYNIQYGVFDLSTDGGVTRTLARGFEGELQKMGISTTVTTTNAENEKKPSIEVFWSTPLEGFKIGGTYSEYFITQDLAFSIGDTPVAVSTKADGVVAIGSVEYAYENLLLSAEYKNIDVDFTATGSEPVKKDIEDYYFMGSYRFSEWFELGLYYSISYDTKHARERRQEHAKGYYTYIEESWLKDLALSARYDINDNWTIKLEGHLMDGLAGVDTTNSEDKTDPDWFLYAVKASYNF